MQAAARAFPALTAGALLVALAGCTPPPQPEPSVVPTPTPTATAEAQPLANADCEQLLDPTDLARTLGGSTEVGVSIGALPLVLVGGLGCYFMFGEQGSPDSGQVLVNVAPQTIADPGEREASLAPAACAADDAELMTVN